jgi:hypothetical protein
VREGLSERLLEQPQRLHRARFAQLWDEIYWHEKPIWRWAANPEIVVLDFKLIMKGAKNGR